MIDNWKIVSSYILSSGAFLKNSFTQGNRHGLTTCQGGKEEQKAQHFVLLQLEQHFMGERDGKD